jgi:hypothetical protein
MNTESTLFGNTTELRVIGRERQLLILNIEISLLFGGLRTLLV